MKSCATNSAAARVSSETVVGGLLIATALVDRHATATNNLRMCPPYSAGSYPRFRRISLGQTPEAAPKFSLINSESVELFCDDLGGIA